MQANKFYSVPYDGHHWADVRLLAIATGDAIPTAYGRWHILLGAIYQMGGRIILTAAARRFLSDELDLDPEALEPYLEACAACGLIEPAELERGAVVSRGACEELQRRRDAEANGRKGGRPRKDAGA